MDIEVLDQSEAFFMAVQDYPKYANDEILKFAMIETKESLGNLDEIMSYTRP